MLDLPKGKKLSAKEANKRKNNKKYYKLSGERRRVKQTSNSKEYYLRTNRYI